MPLTHALRLAKHFSNTPLAWVDDCYTLILIDQSCALTDHLHTYLAADT